MREVRIVQKKMEEERREGAWGLLWGREKMRERGRNIWRESVRGISVRNKQKLSSSSNLAVDAQKYVSTTKPEPRSGQQDILFIGTSRRLQVTHLGTSGNKRESRGLEVLRSRWNVEKMEGLRSAERGKGLWYTREKMHLFVYLFILISITKSLRSFSYSLKEGWCQQVHAVSQCGIISHPATAGSRYGGWIHDNSRICVCVCRSWSVCCDFMLSRWRRFRESAQSAVWFTKCVSETHSWWQWQCTLDFWFTCIIFIICCSQDAFKHFLQRTCLNLSQSVCSRGRKWCRNLVWPHPVYMAPCLQCILVYGGRKGTFQCSFKWFWRKLWR